MPKIDKTLYVVAIIYMTFMLPYLSALECVVQYTDLSIRRKYDQIYFVVDDVRAYTEFGYFLLYTSVIIFCLISIRRIDTKAYSPQTLSAYKRMTLAHFIQVG